MRRLVHIALAAALLATAAIPTVAAGGATGTAEVAKKKRCKAKGKGAEAAKKKCKSKKKPVTPPPPAPASLSINPASWDFGIIAAPGGQSSTKSFTVTNTGGSPTGALVRSFSGPSFAAFVATNDGCNGANLAGGASCTLDVKCQAQGAGDVSLNAMLNVGSTLVDASATLACLQNDPSD